VVRCRFGGLVQEHCAESGESCSSDQGGAFCAAAADEIADDPIDPTEELVPDGGGVEQGEVADADGGLSSLQGDGSEHSVADEGCAAVPVGEGTHPIFGVLLLGLVRRRRRR
jgi:MYXO-CTERM domain-containing protein